MERWGQRQSKQRSRGLELARQYKVFIALFLVSSLIAVVATVAFTDSPETVSTFQVSYEGKSIQINNAVISNTLVEQTYEDVQQSNPNVTKSDIATAFIGEELLFQRANAVGIAVSDAEVDESVDRLIGVYQLSPTDFEEQLAAEGSSVGEFKEAHKKQLLVIKLIAEEVNPDSITVDPQEVDALIEEDPNLESVRPFLEQQLLLENQQKAINDYVENLWRQAEIA